MALRTERARMGVSAMAGVLRTLASDALSLHWPLPRPITTDGWHSRALSSCPPPPPPPPRPGAPHDGHSQATNVLLCHYSLCLPDPASQARCLYSGRAGGPVCLPPLLSALWAAQQYVAVHSTPYCTVQQAVVVHYSTLSSRRVCPLVHLCKMPLSGGEQPHRAPAWG